MTKYYVRSGEVRTVITAANPTEAARKVVERMLTRRVNIVEMRAKFSDVDEFLDQTWLAMHEAYASLGWWTLVSERGYAYGEDTIRCKTDEIVEAVLAGQ